MLLFTSIFTFKNVVGRIACTQSSVCVCLSTQVDSAFYPPSDGKMSTSQKAVMLCGWEGNRMPGEK